jgi:ATP-dependent DNA helicase Rep
MRERVGELLPGKLGHGLTVSTFHSLGLHILRAEARRLGYKPRFSILDATDTQQILSDILKSPDKGSLRLAAALISNWKNALLTPDAARDTAADEGQRQVAIAYLATRKPCAPIRPWISTT